MGRSLRTSLFNLGLNEVAESVLADADIKIDTIYDQEPDAGLGNGGLGRLAACYLDGMATDCIPGTGYSILYEYGIFKQKIVDGWQQETADNWLPGGQVWIKSHPDQAQEIRFDGQAIETWEGGFHHVKYENYNSVIAVPNDMYVAGYGSQGVSKLRLWQAKAPSFDMRQLQRGQLQHGHQPVCFSGTDLQDPVPQRQPHRGQDPAPAPAVLLLGRFHCRYPAEPSEPVRHAGQPAREGRHPAQRHPPHRRHPRDDAYPAG